MYFGADQASYRRISRPLISSLPPDWIASTQEQNHFQWPGPRPEQTSTMDTRNLYQSPCPVPVSVPVSVPEPNPAMSMSMPMPPTTTTTTPTTTTTKENKENEPKRKKPSSRSTLFWVHSDPQSATEGSREETLKRIRSHVMSEHNRKKRETTKRHAKTWKHLAFQPVETPVPEPTQNTAGPVVRKNPSKRRDQRPERGDHEQEEAAEIVPWPVGRGLDPFSVTHTQLSDRMCRHLQHCKRSSLHGYRNISGG